MRSCDSIWNPARAAATPALPSASSTIRAAGSVRSWRRKSSLKSAPGSTLEAEAVKIGVVSDTHGFSDPRLQALLAGVEVILHAGDVGNQEVLHELERIAPVRAVRGNVDHPQLGLPLTATSRFGVVQVEIVHQLPVSQTELEKWANHPRLGELGPRGRDAFLRSFDHKTRVVIFGHSHEPCAVVLAGKLFFNPGSAGKQRFSLPRCCGLLEVSPKGVEATILSLERYNRKLPEKVCLPVGG
jgi:putative phosphoesterase